MDARSRILRLATVAALPLAIGLAGCQSGDPSYPAQREAPAAVDPDDPDEDATSVEVELDDGAVVTLWIDDERTVLSQRSDPDDGDAWTEPEELFTAGDGCLEIGIAARGQTVAATLECYEESASEEEPPDQAQAVVSTDGQEWAMTEVQDLYAAPSISPDGSRVVWSDHSPLLWTEDDGFDSDQEIPEDNAFREPDAMAIRDDGGLIAQDDTETDCNIVLGVADPGSVDFREVLVSEPVDDLGQCGFYRPLRLIDDDTLEVDVDLGTYREVDDEVTDTRRTETFRFRAVDGGWEAVP